MAHYSQTPKTTIMMVFLCLFEKKHNYIRPRHIYLQHLRP